MRVTWDSPLTMIGGKQADKVVAETGFTTVGELLGHYPRTYVDKGRLSELDDLVEGDLLSLVGEVVRSELRTYVDKRTKRTAYRVVLQVKGEGATLAMTFFAKSKGLAEFHERLFRPGAIGMFSGKLKWFNNRWDLNNPNYRMYGAEGDANEALAKMPDLIPIYPVSGKIDSWRLEELIGLALDLIEQIPDALPAAIRAERELIGADQAYRWIHRPNDHRELGAARKRLKFDEAFVTQAVLARRRAALREDPATPRPRRSGGILERFDERLPFSLTAGQQRIGDELADELAGVHPMHRLLQGEVGSGKTLVALRAMLQVVDAGGQAALLAPTEVLASQHLRSMQAMLGDLGEGGLLGAAEGATRLALLTGSLGAAARRQAMLDAASGEAGIVIGTHALLEEKVQFFDLGLVVVDEQHRFGVEQRAALTVKAGTPPHVLVMTATPIPRTVAMTVFGDLDTSTLAELPAGRGEVQTNVVPVRLQPAWLDRAWARIREEVEQGHQAYVVCARIGDEPVSPDGAEEGPLLHAVEDLAPELAEGPLTGLRVEMLHGRMSPEDKDRVMRAFAAGEVDVLVSTTVIEVGVDVPNATVMVILDAERFGVSQLHQLRGRIGRGGHAGLCLLVTSAVPDSPSMERLTAVAGTRDGFELSRIDLEQRREGNVLGTQQSGRRSSLRLLSVLTDEDVILAAREAATAYLAVDPELTATPGLRAAVLQVEDSERAEFLGQGLRAAVTRIIGGTAKGRRLRTPAGDATRPTSDRVREALFSALEARLGTLAGLRVLDLYAGSGAVGLEAASRGAVAVTAVESDKRTAALVSANARTLGLAVEVIARPVARALATPPRARYDVVFADPPYPLPGAEVTEALALLVEHHWLAPGAAVVVERSARSVEPVWPAGLGSSGAKKYGETVLWYLRRAHEEDDDPATGDAVAT